MFVANEGTSYEDNNYYKERKGKNSTLIPLYSNWKESEERESTSTIKSWNILAGPPVQNAHVMVVMGETEHSKHCSPCNVTFGSLPSLPKSFPVI